MRPLFFLPLLLFSVICNAQRPVSLEIPLYFAGNFILVSEPYSQSLKTSGGIGGAGGLGFKINPLTHLALHGGIEFWRNHFEADYPAEFTDTAGNFQIVQVNDDGNFRYAGIYTTAFFAAKSFFVGGGFQFSVVNTYNGKITARDGGVIVFSDEDAGRPNLSSKNMQQAYMVAMIGFRLRITDKFFVKPAFSAGIPLTQLLDAGVNNSDFYIGGVWLRAGIITELVMKDLGVRGKRKDIKTPENKKRENPDYPW